MSPAPNADEPPSSPNPATPGLRRRALQISLVEGGFATVHTTLTGVTYLTGYAVMLGASDFHLGLMNSFPHFLQLFQVIAAYVTWKVGSRRTVCASGVYIFRGITFLLALLPFVPGLTNPQRVLLLLGLLFVSNLAAMFTANAWSVWMADLVPEQIRGRYFGFRSKLALVITVTSALAGAALLDSCRQNDSLGERMGFLLIFGISAASAMTGLGFLRRQWEPPMRADTPPTPRQLLAIFQNTDFRRLCTFFFVWNFGIGLSASFFSKHMIQQLHMDYRMMTLYSVVVGVVGFFSSRSLGRVMDSWGTKPTLGVCASVISVLPLLWLFPAPGRLAPLWFDGVLTGVFWTGFQLAALNLPWIVTPEKNRAYYLGVFTTVAGLGVGSASLLSGQLAQALAGVRVSAPWLGHPLVNYHFIFIFATLVRLASLPLLPRDGDAPVFNLPRLFRPRRGISRLRESTMSGC